MKPIICLKVSIHAPGSGRNLKKAGTKATRRKGNARPSPATEKKE